MRGCSILVAKVGNGTLYLGKLYEGCAWPGGSLYTSPAAARKAFEEAVKYCATTGQNHPGKKKH